MPDRPAPDLAAAVAGAPSPMALLDADSAHLSLSAAWADLHGYAWEAMRGVRYDRLFSSTASAWTSAWVAAQTRTVDTARAADAASVTARVLRPDGEVRWVRFTVRAAPGRPDAMLVHGLDVTEEAERTRAAGRQRSLVEALARHAPMGLFAFDVEGRLTLRAGEGLGGAAPDNTLWGAADLLQAAPAVADGVRAVLSGRPAAWMVETGGRSFDVSAAPTFGPDGATDGGVGVAIDVTDRVAAEEQAALQAEGLRRLVTAVSRPGRLATLAPPLLAEMTSFLGLGGGLLARVADDTYTVLAGHAVEGDTLAAGTQMPLGDTYCDLTMEAGDVVAIDHMGTSPYVTHRCYAVVGLEAYIGAPVLVDGEPYGAISFSSTRPASRPFTEADRDLVRLAAQWAGGLIERERLLAARGDADLVA